MATPSEPLTKALFGDEATTVVKAGTFAVTRGAGAIAAAFGLAANLTELGESLTTEQRLVSTIAVGISWVVLAAVDILARAYVTAHVPAPSPAAEAAPTEDRRANRSAEVPAVATNGSTSTRRPSGAECAEVAIIVTGERLVRGATT